MVDIQHWLQDVRVREDDKERGVLNDSRFEGVKLVAERICNKMNALATDDYESFPEPLRWSM